MFRTKNNHAFTLIELLMVIAILALLVSILVPSLAAAKHYANTTRCKMNIRTLQIGNELYQADHAGFYAPAASNWMANRDRWFGSRPGATGPFTKDNGALNPYLPGNMVRDCPEFSRYLKGFEAGCGGYGYNESFVGAYVIPGKPLYATSGTDYDRKGNKADAFRNPSATVAFTDTAFAAGGDMIEYSFAEPPRYSMFNMEPRPSIHFRHQGRANVAWLDTHVTDETMSFSNTVMDDFYGVPSAEKHIGWFGPKSNELFDCE